MFNLNLLRTLQQQWRNLSTEPIAHQQATVAVKSAYAIIGFAEPEIIFCSSPYAALTSVDRYNLVSVDGYRLWLSPLERELFKAMRKSLNSPLWSYLYVEIPFRAGREVERQLEQQLKHDGMKLKSYMTSEALLRSISTTEFFISEYSFVLKDEEQEALQCLKQLFSSCGWLFPFEKVCIVCDRPRILSFDNQERLHAEGSPAIQFADGWSVYAYHGVRLLEKYGKVHPNQWQAQWLLEEKNAELRRVLIQGIGYDRICQELQAIELDSGQEYTLIQIDSDVDLEPIYLLKMTCPSTGYIHALRVPPDMKSAREAIFWVNWGVDPEEFSVQT
ncbi:DUF6745 domain-containing protein [Allocoleopsis sp.]|uniref:DUF6745 domain-containing protein n=1 Tax=Allocoleopsis sp. TaxID=3088169 RepID=UPI0039C86DD7